MRNAALGLVILFMAPGLASGQQSSDPPPARAVIEGAVINTLNGRMVPRATVVLRNAKKPADAKSTRADGTGHFVFKDVDPGAYRLSADRQGYFYDSGKWGLALRVEVSTGEQRKDLRLRLMPTAVVTGQIMDENADPIQHVQVKLLARAYRGRRMVLDVAGLGLTDDRGEYRIYDVLPGHYYILAQATATLRAKGLQVIGATGIVGVIQVASGAEPDPEPDFTYAPQFYPGTSDFLQAQSLPVRPGEELHSDFLMTSSPSVAVQGKVVNGITGAPANHPVVTVSWSEHWDSGIDAKVSAEDATFEAHDLAPGTHTLRTSFTEDGLTYTGQQTVEVGPLGIRNVLLIGLPDSEIAGTVRVEGSEQERSAVKRVAIEFLGKDTPNRSTATATLPDLQFKTALHPGDSYTVAALNLPLDYYLKGVNLSGHRVLKNDVVVSDRRGAIELVVSPDGGHLEGTVVDDNGQPVAAAVVLVPEATKRDDRSLFRQSVASSKGKFALRGIAPGTYTLLALDDVDFEELVTHPEILKPYEDGGQSVTVDERGNYNVLLKIIRTGEEQ